MAEFTVNFTAKGAEEIKDSLAKMLDSAAKVSIKIERVNDSLQGAGGAAKKLDKSASDATGSVDQLAKQQEKLAFFTEELGKKVKLSSDGLTKAYEEIERSLGVLRKTIESVDQSVGKAVKSIDGMGDQSEESSGQIQDNFGLIEEKAQELLDVLLNVGTGAVTAFAEFDSALRQSAVVGGLTEKDVQKLTDAVIQLGVETSASPAQVAEMSSALSRAGFTAEEQINSLEGMIRASEATGEEFSVLTNVVGNTIRTFGLAASESNNVGDILVSAANNTNTSIGALGEAFAYVGTQAVQSSQPIADVAIALGLLADNGLEGSVGGTALAEALRRLSLASAGANAEFSDLVRGNEKMVQAFKQLEVKIRDAQGNLLPLTEILPIIKTSFDQIASQEDKEVLASALFGVQGSRGFLSLLEQVDTRLQSVSDSVKNSSGVAKEAGAQILDGVSGSLDIFGSTLETLSIKLGQFLAVAVEPVVQGATALLNGFLGLNPAIQQIVFGVGSLAAAYAAAITVITIYNGLQVKQTLTALAESSAKARQAITNFSVTKSIQALNLAMARSVQVMYGSSAASSAAAAGIGSVGVAATGTSGALTGLAGILGSIAVTLPPLLAAIAAVGLALASFEASTKPARDADESIKELTESFNKYAESIGGATIKTKESVNIFKELVEKIGDEIPNAVKELFKTLQDMAYNFNFAELLIPPVQKLLELIPGIDLASAAEASANRLITSSSDINTVLNALNTSFINFKATNELGSEAAQGLVIQLQRAKDAIAAMQEAGVANSNVGAEQLAIWGKQQQELSGMINALNAAKKSTDDLKNKQSETIDVTAQLQEMLAELSSGLESAMQGVDAKVLDETIAATKRFMGNTERRESAIASIESKALGDRISIVKRYLDDRKRLTGLTVEQEAENQKAILDLETQYGELRLKQLEQQSDRRVEIERSTLERLEKESAQVSSDSESKLLEKQLQARQIYGDDQEALDNKLTALEAEELTARYKQNQEYLIKLRGLRFGDADQEEARLNKINELEKSLLNDRVTREEQIANALEAIQESEDQAIEDKKQKQLGLLDTLEQELSLRSQILGAQKQILEQLVSSAAQSDESIANLKDVQKEALTFNQLLRANGLTLADIADQYGNQYEFQQALNQLQIDGNSTLASIQQKQLEIEAQQYQLKLDRINAEYDSQLALLELERQRDILQLERAKREAESIQNEQERAKAIEAVNGQIARTNELYGKATGAIGKARDAELGAVKAEKTSTDLQRTADEFANAVSDSIEQKNRNKPEPPPEPSPTETPPANDPTTPEKDKPERPLQQFLRRYGGARASGGPVQAGKSYIVGEKRPELFVPRVPGTIVPQIPQNPYPSMARVEGLLQQLVNRPVPTLSSNATFVNEPNPLQSQIAMLQSQMRMARGI